MVVAMVMPRTLEEDRDQALIRALASGDGDALTALMRRHGRWVRGVVFAVLGGADQVDDVTQQVWLTVWQRGRDLEDTRRWRNWLYRLARNAAIDAGRKASRRRNLWHRLTGMIHGRPATSPPPEQRLLLHEEHQRVLAAIQRIPEIYREAFVLRHVDDMTYQKIAETLGVAPETVGTRLVRARRHLAGLLQE